MLRPLPGNGCAATRQRRPSIFTNGSVVLSSGSQASSAAKSDGAARWAQRDAHLFAVPCELRAPHRRHAGRRASCAAASGTPIIWESCRDPLLLLAAVAAPYLARLPVTHIERMAPEEYLPVIGQSMQCVVEMVRAFAKQDETLLFVGPAGIGKASLARWSHACSPVKSGPFEMIHLAEIPEEQQILELFGTKVAQNGGSHPGFMPGNGHGNSAHSSGVNGSAKDTSGVVARADKGTLFIDECDRLTPAAQAALLRFLEEKRYRIGGDGEEGRHGPLHLRHQRRPEEARGRGNFAPTSSTASTSCRFASRRCASARTRSSSGLNTCCIAATRRPVPPAGHHHAGCCGQAHQARLAGQPAPARRDHPSGVRAFAQIDHSSAADGIALRAEHIEQALQYEGKGSPRTLLDHLDSAAEAFVAEAERRTETGIRLDMDLADSFKGLVIEAAKRRWSPEDKDAVRRRSSSSARRPR